MAEEPDKSPERLEIRPLSRRATRIFVILAVVLIVGGAVGLAWLLVEEAQDPATQERLRELQELETDRQEGNNEAEPLFPSDEEDPR